MYGFFASGIPGSSQATGWFPMKIGGGGYATGIDLQADGTKLARTNTGGGYKWNGSKWVQLVDTNLPSAVWIPRQLRGVMELVAAPSLTSTFYLHYSGFMLRSTNSGVSWTNLTAWTQDTDNSNGGPGGASGAFGPIIAVDPNNANNVWAGNNNTSGSGGLWKSTDGGTTWSQISTSTIPQPSSGSFGVSFVAVAFQPGSSTVMYAASYGNGCYKSANGGTSWTSIVSGGPSSVMHISVDANGNLWAADNGTSGGIWRYNGTSWLNTVPSTNNSAGYWTVVSDPATPGNVFAATGLGNINVTTNGNATTPTWSGLSVNPSTVTATDVPWLGVTNQTYMTIGQIAFDPSQSHVLYCSAGTGVFFTTPPTSSVTSTTVNWTSQTAGQESLVVNAIISNTSIDPIVGVWDRNIFRITNKDAYSNSETAFPASAPWAVWSLDWASASPTTLVMVDTPFGGGGDISGKSTDGGQTWAQFAAKPSFVNSWPAGGIAAADANKFLWIRGDAANAASAFTSNGGTSWTATSGLPTDASYKNGQNRVVADRDQTTNPGVFYVYSDSAGAAPGVYKVISGVGTKVHTGALDNGNGAGIYSVPGNAGHLFLNAAFDQLVFSKDGGVTWSSAISNGASTFSILTAVGFGAIFPSQSYPSIYCVGTDNAGTYGAWRCINFNPTTASGTWTNLGYPGNTFETIQTIEGDKTVPQLVYVGTVGTGCIYGYFT